MRESVKSIIPYNPGTPVYELEQQLGRPIVKLVANESLWGPSPEVCSYLKDCANEIGFYPDGGALQLKKALAERWHMQTENFCIGNGSDEIIFMLANACLNPGDEVVIPTPTFSEYATAAQAAGGKVHTVSQPYLSFNLKEVAKAVSDNTRIVFLCNPNNPTGTFFTHQDLQEFLGKMPPETLVVLDEAYCHYANNPLFPSSATLLRQFQNMVVLRTFSKVYSLAALRIGYAVAAPSHIANLEKVRQPFNANTIAQRAAFLALMDEQYMQKVVRETIAERTWLTEQLLELDLNVLPSQSNFLLVQAESRAAGIAEKLLADGILVRHTVSFGLPDWLRITVGPHPFMEQLVASLKKIL